MDCTLVGTRGQVDFSDGRNFAGYFATFVDRNSESFFEPNVLEVVVAGIILRTLEFLTFDGDSDNSMDSRRKRNYGLGEIVDDLGLNELSEDELVEDSDTEKDSNYEQTLNEIRRKMIQKIKTFNAL